MSRTRGTGGLGSSILAAVVMAATSAAAHAQNGFSADPFWPYNNQYTPYANPITPGGGPEGGGPVGTLNSREGIRSANRFEDYLEGARGGTMQGPGRNLSDRSGIGLPYYRSSVDPDYQVRGRSPRQYTPNARTTETFEQSQRQVSDFYFEYSSERDPEIRARLWRQYQTARRQTSLGLSGRGSAARRTAETEASLDASEGTGRSNRVRRFRPQPTNDLGPPPIPATSGHSDSSPGFLRRNSSPRDVLNRSRALDRPGANPSSPTARGLGPTPPSRRPSTTNLDRP